MRKRTNKHCECGCGGLTFLNVNTKKPNRFLHGHTYKNRVGPSKGKKQSAETKEKRSISLKRAWKDNPRTISAKTRKKISLKLIGRKLPKSTCLKMSISRLGNKNPKGMLGKHHTQKIKNIIGSSCRGNKSYNWQGGKPHCGECGKEVNYGKHLCKKCSGILRRGKSSYNWKGGISKPHKCISCSTYISGSSKRCRKCYGKYRSEKYVGKHNPAWNGGSSFGQYAIEFNDKCKESSRIRYGRICQYPGCGKTEEDNGRKLDVHHIDYNKQNCSEDNLIPLCKKHHMKTSGKREYHIKLFKEIVKKYFNKVPINI